MAFSLFLLSRRPVEEEILKRSFAEATELTYVDARLALKHPTGVLARGLPRDSADNVARALSADGVGVAVVDDAWLRMPHAIVPTRVEIDGPALVIADHLGESTEIPWPSVAAISAGRAPIGRVTHQRGSAWYRRDDSTTHYRAPPRRPVLDLIVENPLRRIRLHPDLGHVRGRPASEEHRDFIELVRDVVARAPRAALSRGANGVVSPDTPSSYRIAESQATSTKAVEGCAYHAVSQLDTELSWLLWRYRGPGLGAHGHQEFRAEPFITAALMTTSEGPPMKEVEAGLAAHLSETRFNDVVVALPLSLGFGVLAAIRFQVEGTVWFVSIAIFCMMTGIATYDMLRRRRRRRFWVDFWSTQDA